MKKSTDSAIRRPDSKQNLIRMVDWFTESCAGLFSISQQLAFHGSNSEYAYLIVKATKRLATALSLDLELLVIFTPFRDQQQRTIKSITEIIEKYQGRLDPAIAVIVHRDPDGDSKLKKWGKSSKLLILPVYAKTLNPDSTELERILSFELFSHDAFDITGPVSDDEHFYDRRNEAQVLVRKLRSGEIRTLWGIRKIGKTSVINRIIEHIRSTSDCYSVMVDCSKDEISTLDAGSLMASLASALSTAFDASDGYAIATGLQSGQSLAESASELLRMLRESSRPVIFFLDEVDYITPGSPTSNAWGKEFNPFWRNLRAIYQETSRGSGVFSILIGGVSSKWFQWSPLAASRTPHSR